MAARRGERKKCPSGACMTAWQSEQTALARFSDSCSCAISFLSLSRSVSSCSTRRLSRPTSASRSDSCWFCRSSFSRASAAARFAASNLHTHDGCLHCILSPPLSLPIQLHRRTITFTHIFSCSIAQTWPIATDVTRSVVCVSVCWSQGCIAQNGWTNRDAVWRELTHVSPWNHVLDGSQDRNPFSAEMGGKSAMRPFAKLLWTLVLSFSHTGLAAMWWNRYAVCVSLSVRTITVERNDLWPRRFGRMIHHDHI